MEKCVRFNDTEHSELSGLESRFWAPVFIKNELLCLVAIFTLIPSVFSAEIALSWNDNSDNESGFRVERSTDGVSFSLLGTVEMNVTTYSDETVEAAATYWYRVNAYNDYGSSEYTNVVSHTVEPEINSVPTIIGLSNQTIDANSGNAILVSFTIFDEETIAEQLLVSATSSGESLIPSQNVVISGSGASRSVSVTPAPESSGSSTITVYVTDGVNTVSDSFIVTVSPIANFAVSDPPNGSTYHLGDDVSIDLSILGGVDPVSVVYFLDGISIATVEEAPFNRSIGLPVTGTLSFHVVVQLSDGSELSSDPVEINVEDIVIPSSLTVSRLP